MENRNGLVVATVATPKMLDRTLSSKDKRRTGQQITLGADTQYQEEKFVRQFREREVAPHISESVKGNLGKNSLNKEERADERRRISQRKRKLVERVFGWSKLTGLLRQVKLRGLKRVNWFYRLTIVAYNLVRMRMLIPICSVAA